LIEINDVN